MSIDKSPALITPAEPVIVADVGSRRATPTAPTHDLPYLQAKAWVLATKALRAGNQLMALANEVKELEKDAVALARRIDSILQQEQTL